VSDSRKARGYLDYEMSLFSFRSENRGRLFGAFGFQAASIDVRLLSPVGVVFEANHLSNHDYTDEILRKLA
jgi:hypothetical protein